jgi:hypothetical protein
MRDKNTILTFIVPEKSLLLLKEKFEDTEW